MDLHNHIGAGAPGFAESVEEGNPQKQTPAGAGAAGDQEKDKHGEYADLTAERKRLATVTAELAILGLELRRTTEGPLLVVRHGHIREFRDLDAVDAFAAAAGGALVTPRIRSGGARLAVLPAVPITDPVRQRLAQASAVLAQRAKANQARIHESLYGDEATATTRRAITSPITAGARNSRRGVW